MRRGLTQIEEEDDFDPDDLSVHRASFKKKASFAESIKKKESFVESLKKKESFVESLKKKASFVEP